MSIPLPRRLVKRLPVAAGLLVLVIAMVASTRFLSPEASAARQPIQFSAKTYAAENFPKIAAQITAKATDITVLAPAVDQDLAGAGEKYGNDLGAGQYAFPVKLTGTVTKADADFLIVTVPGLPSKDVVRIPLGMALSGLPIRDATGGIKFGDFNNQTDYQAVANEFKLILQSRVLAPANPSTLNGKTISVVGAWGSGGPPNSYLIQPISIKVES